MSTSSNQTIPLIEDADTTEPTPLVRPEHLLTGPMEIPTDIDMLKGQEVSFTPPSIAPARSGSSGDPVIGLARPKGNASFVERKYRLPTESEIKAAIESTPTESLPVVEVE
jgi:hypothetical protein